MSFKDHFSRQSVAYSRYRPGYPPELIDWVASQAPDRRLAVDCATGSGQAALALHWFDFERFHAECRRVLVPGGVVAAWTYEKFRVDAAVDAVIDAFYDNVVGAFWPPERRYVEQGYQTLPFPWREARAPAFALETDWDLEQVLGYLGSWSSVQRYKDRHGRDPLPKLRGPLESAWGGSGPRRLRWPIHMRLGFA